MSDDVCHTPESDRRNHAHEVVDFGFGSRCCATRSAIFYPYKFFLACHRKTRDEFSGRRSSPTQLFSNKKVSTLSSEIRISGFKKQQRNGKRFIFLLYCCFFFFFIPFECSTARRVQQSIIKQ